MVYKSKTFNVGDKVRILDVSEILFGSDYWCNGEVREVVHVDGDGDIYVRKNGGSLNHFIITQEEFHAIELVEATTPKLTKKRRIEALEKDVARQETELEELRAKIEAFEQKAKSADWLSDAMRKVTKETSDTISKALLEVTPNQRRARIITDAKDFVEQAIEDARDEDGDIVVPDPLEIGNPWFCREIKFVVNAEKRTVVALAIGFCDDKVVGKAIAKCAPDDVFNADIGKAIAVGRLFDLDVERFINAPKPDKFVVGQRVTLREDHVFYGNLPENGYAVGKIEDGNAYDSDTSDGEGWIPVELLKILDDTEAQYE